MIKKIYLILKDFYSSIKLGEFIELMVLPLIITTVLFFVINGYLDKKYIDEFNNTILTISSLLVAFGVSSTTLLFSTSNNNIEQARKFITERKDHNGFKISYFQLIQIRAYYSVICELSLIVITLICNLLSLRYNLYFMFYFNIFLLIHILFVLLISLISLYHLSWKDR